MASAQAQIEVVVKNLNSLGKLNKTLDKLNRTNEKLIRGINTLTSSIDKLASNNGFEQIAQDAKGAGKEIDNVGKKLNIIDAAIKRDKDAKAKFIKNRVETNPLFQAERFVARSFQTVKNRAVRDMALIKQSVEAAKTPFATLAVAAGNFVNVLKQADTAAKKLVQEFNNVILRESLGALERNLNNARTITQELSRDSKLYRKTVEDVIFAEKAVNRELLARKRIVESLTVEQRAFREKINRTIIESKNRGAFTGSGFREFSERADRIRLEASTKQERLEATRALKTSKGFVEQRLKENAARKEAMQMADREIDFERRLNQVLEKRIGIHNRLGFGKNANPQGMFASRGGMGGRVRGGVSSAFIGGAFPFLFGQGGASAAGGALGGAAGGLLGGGLGFGLSLIGTAIGSAIEKFDKLNEKIAVANGRMKAMGFESEFTRKEIEKMAKSLKISKDEAVQVASAFARFGKERALAFGGFFGADTAGFEAISKVRDQATALAAIQTISKDISFEKQKELVALVKTNTAAQIQIKLQTVLLEVQKIKRIELIKEIGLRERLLNIIRRTFNFIAQFTAPGLITTGETPAQRVARELKELEENFAKTKALIDGAMAEIGSVDSAVNVISSFDQLPEVIRKTQVEIAKLKDPMFQVIEAATAISGAFSESFKGIIRGTMSVQQAFANMFSRIADHFADMAAQMAANQIKLGLLKMFANIGTNALTSSTSALSGATLPTDVGGLTTSQAFSAPIKYASGGYVTSPTVGLVGEAGENEYVIPASKMASSMQRYSAGARGDSVVAGGGSSYAGGGGGSSTTVNYSGPILNFNSEEFVPKSAVGEIIATAAKKGASMGETRTMRTFQTSRSARSRVGI